VSKYIIIIVCDYNKKLTVFCYRTLLYKYDPSIGNMDTPGGRRVFHLSQTLGECIKNANTGPAASGCQGRNDAYNQCPHSYDRKFRTRDSNNVSLAKHGLPCLLDKLDVSCAMIKELGDKHLFEAKFYCSDCVSKLEPSTSNKILTIPQLQDFINNGGHVIVRIFVEKSGLKDAGLDDHYVTLIREPIPLVEPTPTPVGRAVVDTEKQIDDHTLLGKIFQFLY
jgi:hypothetical protein